ncbi:hypothetical protein O181_117166 [Austropuccinia psidii MF-1]|uniref:Uncharacterized protein n=1 Tax=Austropuccinia psidii MF-1 TaxID=1389203 RepID=A0A9Q3KC54_9BASI|nr:hypothetical protein [Austropuccinia psidii MF-1]
MSPTLTYHSIQNVQLRHNNVGRGIGPYAHAYAPNPARADAQTPALAHAHANVTTPHLLPCMHMQTHHTRGIVQRALPVSSAK